MEKNRKPIEEAHSSISLFRDYTRDVTKVDKRQTAWREDAKDILSKHGFESRGHEGRYGLVFFNPKVDYVIKLFMKDTAYMYWLKFCLANPGNPYCPKIRGKVVKITDVFMAVRLEKLQPVRGSSMLVDLIMDYAKEGYSKSFDPHFNQCMDFFERAKPLLDIHIENIMMRGHQPVIIDPFYNYYKDGEYIIDPDDISNFNDLF